MPKLIHVSNRLPVTIGDEHITRSSGGLVTALEGLDEDQYQPLWLGWPGGEIADEHKPQVERVLRAEHGCVPVFLSAAESEAHYEGFSNASLWPLLHYMPSKFRYDPAWWDAYRTVNQRFADAVLEVASDDDLVWVHDYQLMLLPAMLSDARAGLRIGFFLHTPFPSYEVFRCHPQREQLVAGILGADLIGFHTFGYLRHFRSSVLRLLGIESDITRIRHGGRTSTLGVYPIGINATRFEQELTRDAFRDKRAEFARTFEGKRIVLSVERLDYSKGLLHRLDAIDEFLGAYEGRERMKFVFVSVPSRENVEEYRELRADVEAKVGHLNGRHTTLANTPIHFIHGSVKFEELTALYSLAEVALVTPLIDGMNLVAKEYVACQRDDETAGVLVLSEFAGAAEELFSALTINPYDRGALAAALRQALTMPADERRARMRPMRERVMRWDARAWAGAFIGDLSRQQPGGRAAAAGEIGDARERVRAAIAAGRRVALFLDYDGTLRNFERDPSAATPTPEIHALVERLPAAPNVDITIISGRAHPDLEGWLGGHRVGLIAEHGAAIRRPGATEWEQVDRNVSYGWKDDVRPLLRLYADSTPGSFIEDKRTSLVWHYRKADPEFGGWKAKELVTELGAVTQNLPLEVRHGNKIVEVTASQVNKGAAVMRILEEKDYDLVICAGDDTTDESMFRLDLKHILSIKVGDGDTRARYRVATPAEFRRFLASVIA